MKYLILISLIGLITSATFAQQAKVILASAELQEGKYVKAMNTIEKATASNKLDNYDRAWKVKGDIYIAILNHSELDVDLTRVDIYAKIASSYGKLKSIDSKGFYFEDAKKQSKFYANVGLNEGVAFYNKRDYLTARNIFLSVIDLAAIASVRDTLALYNIALASDRLDDNEMAIEYYKMCIDLDYKTEMIYTFVVACYQRLGDLSNQKKTIQEALNRFPNNDNILIHALNIALGEGDFNTAAEYAEKLVNLDPSNSQLHFALGTVYDNVGNSDDAMKEYKLAIDTDPNSFDAHYNLGAIFFNKGVEITNLANDEYDNFKREKLLKESELEFYRAKEYLERAHELNPSDRQTLISLKSLYTRLGESEKYEEVKALLKD